YITDASYYFVQSIPFLYDIFGIVPTFRIEGRWSIEIPKHAVRRTNLQDVINHPCLHALATYFHEQAVSCFGFNSQNPKFGHSKRLTKINLGKQLAQLIKRGLIHTLCSI